MDVTIIITGNAPTVCYIEYVQIMPCSTKATPLVRTCIRSQILDALKVKYNCTVEPV